MQEDCNSSECGFDGFDCFLFSDPWELCPKEANCSQHFRDGVCHVDCNSAACLYDGGDCFPSVPECKIAALCIDLADNSECNPECNTLQCPYDAVDCLEKKDFVSCAFVMQAASHMS